MTGWLRYTVFAGCLMAASAPAFGSAPHDIGLCMYHWHGYEVQMPPAGGVRLFIAEHVKTLLTTPPKVSTLQTVQRGMPECQRGTFHKSDICVGAWVVDGATNAGMAGVKVNLCGKVLTTDAGGMVVRSLAPGSACKFGVTVPDGYWTDTDVHTHLLGYDHVLAIWEIYKR